MVHFAPANLTRERLGLAVGGDGAKRVGQAGEYHVEVACDDRYACVLGVSERGKVSEEECGLPNSVCQTDQESMEGLVQRNAETV